MPGALRVTDVVWAEAVWTLKSAFDQDQHAQTLAVRTLLEETAFQFEDREAVAAAPGLFEAGSCGFADCLVVAKYARQACDFTASFDRGMCKLQGLKVLRAGLAERVTLKSRCWPLHTPSPQTCSLFASVPSSLMRLLTDPWRHAGTTEPQEPTQNCRWVHRNIGGNAAKDDLAVAVVGHGHPSQPI